ncbi:MAG: hypothetical protein KAW12_05115 [Candidatus Aminicenantes bacterium]|nr:hypothetical protein [Candidatus Aminicenantes bacterium]
MAKIVFEKLTIKEVNEVVAGVFPYAELCGHPDIPSAQCNVNSSVDSGCNPKKYSLPAYDRKL